MIDDIFTGRLLAGERIAWSGRPGQGLIFTQRDLYLVPFSLAWCGFAIFWECGVASSEKAPVFFLIWGGMFIGIGLFVVVGRFVVDAWLRRAMHYALTDRRILIARRAPFSKFTAIALAQLPGAAVSERADGRGTIRFVQGAAASGGQQAIGLWLPALDPTPQFIMIDDARRVFDLVQRRLSGDAMGESRALP